MSVASSQPHLTFTKLIAGLVLSGHKAYPHKCMNHTENLWVLSVSTEPSAITHPRHLTNSEPLKPDRVITQRPNCITHLMVSLQNSHSHSKKGATVIGCNSSPVSLSCLQTAQVFPEPAIACIPIWIYGTAYEPINLSHGAAIVAHHVTLPLVTPIIPCKHPIWPQSSSLLKHLRTQWKML